MFYRALSRKRIWMATVLAGCQLFLMASISLAQSAAKPEKWMQQIADQIGGVPMRGIAMPGTHDAAMYKGMANIDIAKTQTGDFMSQLKAGARWIDFRFLYLDNTTCSDVTPGPRR